MAEWTPSGVAFRPSRGRSRRTLAGMLAFAIAFPIVLAAAVLVFDPAWVASGGAVLSLVAFGVIVSGAAAVAVARCRSSVPIPLVAEASGRVLYGPRVLLDTGASARLYVEERWHGGEESSWKTFRVVASNRWGPVVQFPAPWFDEFDNRAEALWFARQLAAVIGAEVQDAEPGAAADPAS